MLVGVPKEIKEQEYRVGLTPDSVGEYVAHGHRVLVQVSAGIGMGALDSDYRSRGAELVDTPEEIFHRANMIVKVKEPQPSEWSQLREGQILFAYLHLAADRAQTEGLLKSGCTAVAYETVTDDQGGLPLLAPMSEVAGRLSIEAAAGALRRTAGGRGLLIGGVPGVAPANILIIGGGVAGANAAKIAIGMEASVTILDRSIARLRELNSLFSGRVRTRFSTLAALDSELAEADAVIGAVLIPGASTPKLVTREMVKQMKQGAVIVDVAIDQGGCFETSHPTTHANPTYEVDGVIHYCVANIPAAVPLTSSHAHNNATLPFGLAIAAKGLKAFAQDPHLRAGLNIHRGAITSRPVAESLGLPLLDPSDLAA